MFFVHYIRETIGQGGVGPFDYTRAELDPEGFEVQGRSHFLIADDKVAVLRVRSISLSEAGNYFCRISYFNSDSTEDQVVYHDVRIAFEFIPDLDLPRKTSHKFIMGEEQNVLFGQGLKVIRATLPFSL